MEVIGGAMPLMAGCGAMPLDGDGGAKLPQEDNGVMSLGGTAARSRHEDRRQARRRCCLGWCDAISKMGRCDSVVIGVAKAPSTTRGGRCVRQDNVVMGTATASTTTRWCMVVSGAATASTTTRWCSGGVRRCDGVVLCKEKFLHDASGGG